MFYEEKTIKNILSCESCNEKLDIPKKLPCGSTICTQCESEIQQLDNQFECKLCSDIHQISVKGLPVCKIILNLLQIKPNEISRGQAVEQLKQNLNEIKQQLNKLNTSLNTGQEQIKEHCNNLRAQIHLSSENCIKQINEMNREFIKTVNTYEFDCIEALQQNDYKQQDDFVECIDELKKFESKWTGYLTQIDIKEETILKVNSLAKDLIQKAEYQSDKLEDFIFNGNYLKYERVNKVCLGRFESRTHKFNSTIVSNQEMKDLMIMCRFPLNQTWKLLYRATHDGFGASDFHRKVDNYSNTLTIIKSTNGNVFGGYTEQDWSGSCFKSDLNAFIFSLKNSDNKPIVMKCLENRSAICCSTTCGVIFGNNSSCDILLCDNSDKVKGSGSNLGSSYKHPNYEFDTDEANSFLAGSIYFQTLEIETFTIC